MATKRLSKKDIDKLKQQGYVMFMGFVEQKDIAEILCVSEKTISGWVSKGLWKEKRGAATVTRDELINKTLLGIGKMLDAALTSGDKDFGSISDGLNKMANTIEKLDKKNNIIHLMECFKGFNDDLLLQMKESKEVTPTLIKLINRLQASYVNRRMTNE
ncbi:MAG: terminase [Bacteroidetes bacterium]|nr:terminase [Bacteroidota bacterium]